MRVGWCGLGGLYRAAKSKCVNARSSAKRRDKTASGLAPEAWIRIVNPSEKDIKVETVGHPAL
jgi:hypothetical protein